MNPDCIHCAHWWDGELCCFCESAKRSFPDPRSFEACPVCGSKADICVLCKVCIRCGGDGHDEGCPNEGTEYEPETHEPFPLEEVK